MEDSSKWLAMKNGDKSAFASIYADHASSLLQYGYRFSKNEQLAEDCLQDLFIYLWDTREKIGTTDNIRRYLLVAFRRRLLKEVKADSNRSQTDESVLNFELTDASDHQMILDEDSDAQKKIIKNAYDQLSGRQKEIIYLKFYNELEYDAICEIMEISYQSARNLMTRTLKAMKKIVGVVIIFKIFLTF
jgi:RNA polymerase sigma-70 factor (ECF subfamily)